MQMDETLYSIVELVRKFAVFYLVDITKVPDFNHMYAVGYTDHMFLLTKVIDSL